MPVSECGVPIRNLWYMLTYAWDQVALRGRWAVDVENAPSLDALLITVLARLMQQRLRLGLGRNYSERTEPIRAIRGRIDFGRSVRALTILSGQAFCRFDVFSANVPKNQIVRGTLDRIARVGEFGPDSIYAEELRQRTRRLVRDLDGIDLVVPQVDKIRRLQLGRNDNDYRVMLYICELLLQRHMLTEVAGASPLPALNRDALTLHHVFEVFVYRFLKMRLRSWSVRRQVKFDWDADKSSIYLPTMRPDVILEHAVSGDITVLDTKFTPNILLAGRFDQQRFDQSHVYQIYAYLRSQEQRSEQHRRASGILLYPAVSHHLSEGIELQGHPIRFETIDLALPWQQIECQLIRLIADGTTKPSN